MINIFTAKSVGRMAHLPKYAHLTKKRGGEEERKKKKKERSSEWFAIATETKHTTLSNINDPY